MIWPEFANIEEDGGRYGSQSRYQVGSASISSLLAVMHRDIYHMWDIPKQRHETIQSDR
jgi:hypothetical protein